MQVMECGFANCLRNIKKEVAAPRFSSWSFFSCSGLPQTRPELPIKNPLRLHNASGVVLVPPDKVSASNPWSKIPSQTFGP
ncbi:unnamed protein product [Fusarium venenatum]|uniref:Uncharacterized protein n=1 Tax=Fusarium venenatum TaxID=56646 RepID=A0A2L2TIJ6_9HYPO|nr:uncharacterized protein FVRRES_04486 [Fusarium venenatum]CEI60050.1 unnamed protein product [Fusarium venenatum]